MLPVIVVVLAFVLMRHAVAQQTDIEVVRQTLRKGYIRVLPDSVLNLKSIDSIIKSIADPYTYVAAPDATAYLEDYYASESMDLGLDLDNGGDSLPVIVEVMYGTPAYKAGLCINDTVYEINDVSMKPKTWVDCISAILSSTDKHVKIKVRRGDRRLTFDVPRQSRINCGFEYWINNSIAYVRVAHFSRSTGRMLLLRFLEFKAARIRRVVMDLRSCSGGNLEQALIVLRAFAAEGDTVMRTCFRGDSTVFTVAERDGLLYGKPLEIIVGRGSASAAEVIAVAVQENDYGYVIGDTTFGKSKMQRQFELPSGAWMIFTHAILKGPKGEGLCVDKEYGTGGLVPAMRFTTGTVSSDTLRALSGVLSDLDGLRSKFATVDTGQIQSIRGSLPDSLKNIGVYYIARTVWGEQGRLWYLSQQPRYARWTKPPAIVRSTR